MCDWEINWFSDWLAEGSSVISVVFGHWLLRYGSGSSAGLDEVMK